MYYPEHPDMAWTYPVSASAYPAAAHALLPGSSVPLTGLGEVSYLQAVTVSPLAAVMREAKKLQGQAGVGELTSDQMAGLGIIAGALTLVLAAAAFGGYYTGKAIAPSKDKQLKYGLLGIPVSWVAGPLGLGVMAVVGGRNK